MSRLSMSVLSDAEVEALHERTLDVLERTGVKVMHEKVLGLLRRAGATVDAASGIVTFPRELVEELRALAPATIRMTGLNGRVLDVGGDRRYYKSLVLDPYIVDYQGRPRAPVLQDVRRHTIIGESLDKVSGMTRMEQAVADVPEPDNYLKTMEVFLSHTSKHVLIMPSSESNLRDWMDVTAVITEAAGGDVPDGSLFSLAAAVTSPLRIHGLNVEIIKAATERGYSIQPTICPMAGATSPYSMFGTLLQANAEVLAIVLLCQLYRPGHPVVYAIGPSATDLRTGRDLYYKAEKAALKIAGIQMARFYGLPCSGEGGGSLTWRPDVQNGAESLAYLLASIAGGQNIIGGLGSLHNANGMSPEQIIMQAGLVEMAEFMARGINAEDAQPALDAIERVGPGGQFLVDDLTLERMRGNEFFNSPLFDMTGGYEPAAQDMYAIAHQKVEAIIADHRRAMPGDVLEAIGRFFHDRYRCPETSTLDI